MTTSQRAFIAVSIALGFTPLPALSQSASQRPYVVDSQGKLIGLLQGSNGVFLKAPDATIVLAAVATKGFSEPDYNVPSFMYAFARLLGPAVYGPRRRYCASRTA